MSLEGTSVEQLGERIKRLRKERKMTLADVAGDRLTKGMLSLIENGKANPSMESLQYIASRLDINSSELMQSEDKNLIRELLLNAESLLAEYKETFSKERQEEIKQEYLDRLYPFFENRNVAGSSYEEVRLYELYLIGKYYFKDQFELKSIRKVVEMYENLNAFSKILSLYSFMAINEFAKLNYNEALSFLLEGEQKLNQYEYLIDPLEKLDFYYNLTVVYAAVNDEAKTEHYLNVAMELSKKKKVFYRLNDFYRFLYYVNLQSFDVEKMKFYIRKIKDYVRLIEDPLEQLMLDIITLTFYNVVEKDYMKVINYTFNGNLPKEIELGNNVFINSEKAYAYYHLNDFKQAIAIVKDLKIPYYNTHPIDLSFLYQGFAIRALCQYELENIEEAKRDILYAYDGVKTFSNSIQKQFIVESYEKIIKEKL